MVYQYDELLADKKHWVLVADASRARILEFEKPGGALRDVMAFDHPEGRLRERDISTDREGRVFDSKGAGRHAVGNPERLIDAENDEFARKLLKELNMSWQSHRFEILSVIAPAKFLGTLNQKIDSQLARLIVVKMPKSMVSADCETIADSLREKLTA